MNGAYRMLLRGVYAIVAGALGACLYAAIRDWETVLFGLVTVPFLLPSVVLFVVLEGTAESRLWRYCAYLAPAGIVAAVGILSLSLMDDAARGDGADQMLQFFLECFATGSAASLVYLALSRPHEKAATIQ